MKSTLVFIPCFNCAPQVERLFHALPMELSDTADILLVDNQSDDDFGEIAARLKETFPNFSLQVYRNDQNYGLGGSFKNAYEAARNGGYQHLVLLHGDNQANPNDILRLLARAKSQPELCTVLGARFMPGAQLINFSHRRALANRALNFLASVLVGQPIFELGSGLSVFNINNLPWNFIGRLPDHIAYDFQILLYLIETQSHFAFEPIDWKSEDEVSTISEFKVACQLLGQMVEWRVKGGSRFEHWPWIGARSWHPLT